MINLTPDDITALIVSVTVAGFVAFVFSLLLDQLGD
jgi:VIT1/CCC1 family predicted Fe2+/Mn2+ transporter